MNRQLLYILGLMLSSCIAASVMAQPPPPARSADGIAHWREVLAPEDQKECEVRCRVDSEYEVCTAPVCAAGTPPVLVIRAIDSGIKSPGERIELIGDFGALRNDQVLALVSDDGERQPRRTLYVRHRIEVLSWNENRIVARLHDEVDPGHRYGLVILYNLAEGRRAAPVFKQGSNVVFVEVRSR